MTTKVTVDAHAGWPVLVEAIDKFPEDAEPRIFPLGTVSPGGVQDFYVFDTRQLRIAELARPVAPRPPA